MIARVGVVLLAAALLGAGGPDVGWQSYENAVRISASTGKAVCIVFYNDKVELNGGT